MLIKLKKLDGTMEEVRVISILYSIFHYCERCKKFLWDAELRRKNTNFHYTFMNYGTYCVKCMAIEDNLWKGDCK